MSHGTHGVGFSVAPPPGAVARTEFEDFQRHVDQRFNSLEASINRLTDLVQTSGRPQYMLVLAALAFIATLVGWGGSLASREASHLSQVRDQRTDAVDQRFARNESLINISHDASVRGDERERLIEAGLLVSPDHDAVVRNTERWRLFEEGLLVGLAERRSQ